MIKVFKPTKIRQSKNKVIGFDIETYGQKNHFYCASLYSDDFKEPYRKTFFNKEDLIKEIKRPMFRGSYIVATNLLFDFMGLLFKHKEIKKFKFQFRGSDLIFAKSFLWKEGFSLNYYKIKEDGKKQFSKGSVTFIDTLNYAKMSVKQIGKILSIPKLNRPKALGKIPKNEEEKEELVVYNMRDSEISYKFIKFLFDSFSELGATPKKTIASSSMSLFRNKYLTKDYFQHDINTLIELFQGYYGGRTEAFSRGKIENYNYYDFNSLYPSVMIKKMPDPNSLRTCHRNNLTYINSFEGFSNVEIHCPSHLKYPLLPLRANDKLLFPTGSFRGWYSHIELRYAIQFGYIIKKVNKTHYFKETCQPFIDYVNNLYDLRNKFKKEGSQMELVVKLLLNSLYGKFGQKFMDRDNWISEEEMTAEKLLTYSSVERIGSFFRVKKDLEKPPIFCFPEWSGYITAYARIKLHKAMMLTNPVYVDTDSLITKNKLSESDELGKLKLEMKIKSGYIIKPKFYAFIDSNNNEYVKVKGIGMKILFDDFKRKIETNKGDISFDYMKFIKFKEAMVRNLKPNEIFNIIKVLKLEDDKRVWSEKFNFNKLQMSEPVQIKNF